MTKTPEELTAEWKAGKLPADDQTFSAAIAALNLFGARCA